MAFKKNHIAANTFSESLIRKKGGLVQRKTKHTQLFFLTCLVFILALIVTACSPKMGNGVLKFFFDGVPEKNSKDSVITTTAFLDTVHKNTNIVAPQVTAETYYHPPYKERACTKCHNGDVPGKTTFSQGDVCYSCHTDFQKKYEIVHGPVAGGFCTTCHSPHYSSNKKLLLNKGQAICLNCHTQSQVMKNSSHADIGDASCTECHNPHGGSDRYFSK
jgi:predicted CXXCH cytochrome family protein